MLRPAGPTTRAKQAVNYLKTMARLGNAFALLALATETYAGPNRKKGRHKNQCLHRLDCWLTILLDGAHTATRRLIHAGAIVLAAAYYAYCVYGKSTRRNDKETEPLMPVATATPMT